MRTTHKSTGICNQHRPPANLHFSGVNKRKETKWCGFGSIRYLPLQDDDSIINSFKELVNDY